MTALVLQFFAYETASIEFGIAAVAPLAMAMTGSCLALRAHVPSIDSVWLASQVVAWLVYTLPCPEAGTVFAFLTALQFARRWVSESNESAGTIPGATTGAAGYPLAVIFVSIGGGSAVAWLVM